MSRNISSKQERVSNCDTLSSSAQKVQNIDKSHRGCDRLAGPKGLGEKATLSLDRREKTTMKANLNDDEQKGMYAHHILRFPPNLLQGWHCILAQLGTAI